MLKSLYLQLTIALFTLVGPGVGLAQLSSGAASNPTFDCAKVSSPLPVTICSDEAAAQADWELMSAFWALYFVTEDRARQAFNRAQDDWFRSLSRVCNLSNLGSGSGARPTNQQVSCVTAQYRSRAASYRSKLSGDALLEANLSPQRHKQLQQALISLGLLTGKVEGLFGAQTRTAIRQFQSKYRFAQTGFLSANQERQLIREWETTLAGNKRLDDRLPSPDPNSGSSRAPEIAPVPKPQTEAGSILQPIPQLPQPASPTDAGSIILQPAPLVPMPALPPEKQAGTSFAGVASADDNSLCTNVNTEAGAAACTRLIADGDFDERTLAQLLSKRAATYEVLKRNELALADYTSVLLLEPDSGTATSGKSRLEGKFVSRPQKTAAPTTPAGAQARTSNSAGSLSNYIFGDLRALFLVALIVAFGILLLVQRRTSLKSLLVQTSRSLATSKAMRVFGVSAGTLLVVVALSYLWFGTARSVSAVASVVQHVPLTSQAYFVVPDLDQFLEASTTLLKTATDMVDVARLAKATRGSPPDIRANLARFDSTLQLWIAGAEYRVANGCLDLSIERDRRTAGLLSTTALASFVGNGPDTQPMFVVGPVEKSGLSTFLANASSRYIISLSANGAVSAGESVKLNLDHWSGKGLQLCHALERTVALQSGSTLEINSSRPRAFLTIDAASSIPEDAQFEVRCSYELKGKRQDCKCELFERTAYGSKLDTLGDCGSLGKSFGTHTKMQRSMAEVIRDGGTLPGPLAFDLPLAGLIASSDTTIAKWDGNTLVIGPTKAVESSLAGTPRAANTSILRDDAFVNFYRRTAAKATAFLGAIRPDLQPNPTFFNRLVSVPITFSGSIDRRAISLQASINFEPLDAAILQDMSRGYSGAEGEVPINTYVGSASIRIGDDKVSQYVSFADQFILNRLIQGLSSLDTEDPITNIRTNFIRYVLRKIGLNDGRLIDEDDSFANQPHQIMILDDPPSAWAPSVAVAVKFQSLGAARTFLCAEPSRLQRHIDTRILLNSARAAKQATKTRIPDDLSDYRTLLNETMDASLASPSLSDYRLRYDIDPLLMKVRKSSDSALAEDPRCDTKMSDIPIDGKPREIYFLSPAVDENAKHFYYRFPALDGAAQDRAKKLDSTIGQHLSGLQFLAEASNAALVAEKGLTDVLARSSRVRTTAALSQSLADAAQQLREAIVTAGVEVSLKEWVTVADMRDDLLATQLRASIKKRANEIDENRTATTEKLASMRVQRAEIVAEASRIRRDVTNERQRTVAYIDERRRLLFIASGVDALRRAVDQASPSQPVSLADSSVSAPERIRFYASGDNAIQSVLDLMPADRVTDLPILWRNAKLTGTLLPFEAAYVGLSGQTSGIAVSAIMSLQSTTEKAK